MRTMTELIGQLRRLIMRNSLHGKRCCVTATHSLLVGSSASGPTNYSDYVWQVVTVVSPEALYIVYASLVFKRN